MIRIDRIMLFTENKVNQFNKKMANDTLCLIDKTIAYLIKMLRKLKIRLKTMNLKKSERKNIEQKQTKTILQYTQNVNQRVVVNCVISISIEI